MNIIFDLDGTLWDATQEIFLAWNNVLKKNNPNLLFDKVFFNKIMGLQNQAIELMLEKDFLITDKTFLLKCQDEELTVLRKEGAKLYPNVIETIKKLSKNNNLFIASNCQNGYIDCFLDYYNLRDLFKDYICSDIIYKNKTESLKTLIKRNNITNFYYVGDTYGDYAACTNLGGEFIFANYGFGIVDCKNKISNFGELLSIFE